MEILIPNLFDNSTTTFTKGKKCAGGVAHHAGNEFEKYIETILEENLPNTYDLEKQPTYVNHYGLVGKRKDYKLIPKSNLLFSKC